MNNILKIIIHSGIVISCICIFTMSIQADDSPIKPEFKDYPVSEHFQGKNAPIKLSRQDHDFRTRLKKASKEKPNYAGRYIVSSWGCGMECAMGALIDAKTGRVYWIPFTLCCWADFETDNFDPIEFRLDSKLIIFTGARNEKKGDSGKHYYMFDGKKFVHLLSRIGANEQHD